MDERGNTVHTTETEASGGSKEGVVRWVLIIGTVLAIVFLTLIWVTGAFSSSDDVGSEPSVSDRQLEAQATAESRGEPMAPTMGGPTASSTAATPTGSAMPGDAPAGDPRNTAQ